MTASLERHRKDLKQLLATGEEVGIAMERDFGPPAELERMLGKANDDTRKFIRGLPSFSASYQSWYSEARAVVRQLLPDRLLDLTRHYESPKARKDITAVNYRIEDSLQGLMITGRLGEVIASPINAIPHFRQQLGILRSAERRFESSLFDIRRLVQADLLDSELEAAEELARHGFGRAAGAVAGVVLEGHLKRVCETHGLTIRKKAPSISELNDMLKDASVIEIPQWRSIQYLADVRNLCDHRKKKEPTAEQIGDLVTGVAKVCKTIA